MLERLRFQQPLAKSGNSPAFNHDCLPQIPRTTALFEVLKVEKHKWLQNSLLCFDTTFQTRTEGFF